MAAIKGKIQTHITAQATIQTWGTNGDLSSNGILHYLDSELFGGGEGHAAIELQFPATEEGEKLINEYCIKNGQHIIPFKRKTHITEEGKTEDFFVVRFSWWPNRQTGKPELHGSLEQDQLLERIGTQVHYAERFSDLDNDRRRGRGKLGTQLRSLGPISVIHGNKLQETSTLKEVIEKKSEIIILDEHIESMDRLLKVLDATYKIESWKKRKEKKANIKLTASGKLMLKNLLPAEKYKQLSTTILGKPKLTIAELKELYNIANEHMENLKIRRTESLKEYDRLLKLLSTQKITINKQIVHVRTMLTKYREIEKLLKQKKTQQMPIDVTQEDKVVDGLTIKKLDAIIPNWKILLGKENPLQLTAEDLTILEEHIKKQQEIASRQVYMLLL